MADIKIIRQINTGTETYDISAKYLSGTSGDYTFEQIQGMIQGAAGTFVVKTANSDKEGYDAVVNSTESTLTTTKTILDGLTGATEIYKLGDIVLMEAMSDGEKIFDRWISNIDGENITLAVLETQVAKHHHTITATTGSVLTGASTSNTTSVIPTVGNPVSVISGDDAPSVVVTSVEHDDNGTHSLVLSDVSEPTEGDGSVGHSHTIDSHDHSVSFTPNTLVSSNVDVYTSLTTDSYTPHTHNTTSVAGAHKDSDTLTYATGGGSTDTFVKTLKDVESTTGEESLTTASNTDGLSTDNIGDDVVTSDVSAHTHTVSIETTSDIITDATIADSVITSVSFDYVAPTVQETVVTGVSHTSADVLSSVSATPTSASFLNGCSVNESGVLSFGVASALTDVSISSETATVVGEVSSTTSSQSAGSASMTTSSSSQSVTSGKVSLTGTTSADGAHTHGFSHTHAIPSHTHTIASHSHTYYKSSTDVTGTAYTSLSTGNYTTHTHENVTVISDMTDVDAITFVTDGSKTSVVKDLLDSEQTYTTTSVSVGTDTKYVKLSGDIIFPGLSVGTKSISTTTVTPAVAGTETALASITFTSGDVVVSLSDKTSTNIGGDVVVNE